MTIFMEMYEISMRTGTARGMTANDARNEVIRVFTQSEEDMNKATTEEEDLVSEFKRVIEGAEE